MKRLNTLLVMFRDAYQWGSWAVPPIGLAYISSYLKEKGCMVFPINLNVEEGTVKDVLKKKIYKYKIDAVGTGGLVTQYHRVKEIMDVVKEIDTDIITFMGSGLVTYSPEEAMRGIASADIGIIGEGEITVFQMLSALEKGDDLLKVPGLIIRDEKAGLVYSEPRRPLENLDILPFPDWDGFSLFDMGEFYPSVSTISKPISAPLVTSRGCPFSCTYCSKSGGGGYRQRSLNNIFSELDILVKRYGVNLLYLDDELFAFKPERLYEFCARIKRYDVQWLVFLRVGRHITDDLLKYMKDSGCISICYGFESGSDVVLKSMHKGITTHDIYTTVERTGKAGIMSLGNFIYGDVAETKETVKETFAFAKTLIRHNALPHHQMIILFPGSKLYHKAIEDGKIKDTLKFIEQGCPLVNVSTLSDEEYRDLSTKQVEDEMKDVFLSWAKNSKSVKLEKDATESLYNITFSCECGKEESFKVHPLNIYEPYYVSCKNCNNGHSVIALKSYAEYINGSMEKFFNENKVAVWGASFSLDVLYSFSQAFQNEPWLLVDGNPKIWGTYRDGRVVQDTDSIIGENCNIVIVAARRHYLDIEEIIRKKYPFVIKSVELWKLGLMF